jgi:hypothetical protein
LKRFAYASDSKEVGLEGDNKPASREVIAVDTTVAEKSAPEICS